MNKFLIGSVGGLALLATTASRAGSPLIAHYEERLQALGYDAGILDGEVDQQLLDAAERFRSDQGLAPGPGLDHRLRERIDTVYRHRFEPPPAPTPAPTASPTASPVLTPAQPGTSSASPAPQPPVTAPPAPPAEAAGAPDRTGDHRPPPAADYLRSAHYPRSLGVLFETAAEFGGDNLATVVFSSGKRATIRAGAGYGLAMGLYFKPARQAIFGQALVGYKFASAVASNATVTVERVVAKLGLGYERSGWRATLNGVHHSSIKADFDGLSPNADFENATGVALELGWRWIGISHTLMEYKDEFGTSYQADATGISANFAY